ncbi:hypothetical protein JR316_0006937 [Psilocybe cubensis]|uniref:Uncharacterized protein n=1 Tax=Psilocybe cubensis TaxID=181762 RepID=A0ACB8GXL4_PSICU|nr:hypothetical protein JR316_0006937 [Psilocybe cubensis]KAH9480339.1 hypothetical protein JR316_0006937 [Psilocybe cubensis]
MDRIAYKALVGALWSLEMVDQIFIAYSLYYYMVSNYTNPAVLTTGRIIWSLILQIVMGCLVGTIVKWQVLFRAIVLYILTDAIKLLRHACVEIKHNHYITGGIILMILAQFGLAILYCIRAFQLRTLLDVHTLRTVASLALGAGLLTDFVIAAALCFCLQKMRTGIRKADTLVNTLSLYAVNTGALTGAISLVTLVLYNISPDTFWFMASYFTLGNLYAICFMAALNTRKVLRGKGTDQEGNTSNTSNMQNTFFMVTNGGRIPRPLEYSSSQTKSMEIDIHQEVSVRMDIENARQDNSFHLGFQK